MIICNSEETKQEFIKMYQENIKYYEISNANLKEKRNKLDIDYKNNLISDDDYYKNICMSYNKERGNDWMIAGYKRNLNEIVVKK